jgi:hypothetical protein
MMNVCVYDVCIRREAMKPGQERMKGGVWGCEGGTRVCLLEAFDR